MKRCAKHPFEVGTATCGKCREHFCAECVIYPLGPRKPMCVCCALVASGVRRPGRMTRV
jgi:hypothetical protein